jgi:hypothetical protein
MNLIHLLRAFRAMRREAPAEPLAPPPAQAANLPVPGVYHPLQGIAVHAVGDIPPPANTFNPRKPAHER